ncbi:restriction endonuclease subunit S, partial [Nonomuraea sp. RK-328]|nr:restriction endonuclease subunit S [Nonomuraea sp. RK-328]
MGSHGPVAVVKPKNLADGRLRGIPDRVSEAEAAGLSPYRLRSGDIVCVRTGGVGRHALLGAGQEGWLFGSGTIRIRPANVIDPHYLSHYLSHAAVQDWIRRNGVGTAIPSISTLALGDLPVALAPLDVQRSIGMVFSALTEKIAAHEQICEATAELRDALLPLMFSGQLAPRVGAVGADHRTDVAGIMAADADKS